MQVVEGMERIGKVFLKKTRKGKIKRVLREHYLRDDLQTAPDGGWADGGCIVIDTNVALHQIDFLDTTSASGALRNVIILQTVLDEVKHRSVAVFVRLKKMVQATGRRFHVFGNEHHIDTHINGDKGESPNDRNDRAIRVASKWYSSLLNEEEGDKRKVLLITNDRANKKFALADGLNCMTVHEYVKKSMPECQDLLSAEMEEQDAGGGGAYVQIKGDSFRYREYLTAEELDAGVREGKFIKGTIHMDRNSNLEAFVAPEAGGGGFNKGESKHKGSGADLGEILLSGRADLNRAMDLDKVVVELLPKTEWKAPKGMIVEDEDDEDVQREELKSEKDKGAGGESGGGAQRRPTGRVVGVTRRAWRQYCGTIEEPANPRAESVLFVPVCRQIPKIRISTKRAADYINQRIQVEIDAWDATSKYPRGHYLKTLGPVGDIEVESTVILLENDICIRPFPPKVLRCLPAVGPNGEWDPTEADTKGRVDFRGGNYRVFSVDPPGCKDIDDALHVRPLGPNRTEVGVHIADVTHFVAPGNACDEEARFRGTSVYLVQRRIDMLPTLLTTDLCSLVGHKERLAFSVVWVLDDDANILDVRFHKSVIKSCAAMTYGLAQEMIDDENDKSELARDLRLMMKMTKKLKQKRVDNGALSLASNEVRFELDSVTHDPIDAKEYQMKETNSMVEEMMLLANCSVAEKIHEAYPSCALLRRHPAPPPANFDPLKKVCKSLGFDIDCSSNKALAASLDTVVDPKNPMANRLVRILATRSMSQAVYFASGDVTSSADYVHYGLAAPLYTHFTSPIRR